MIIVASYCWSLFVESMSGVSYHPNGVVAANETNTRLYRTESTNNVLVNMLSLTFLPTLGTNSQP